MSEPAPRKHTWQEYLAMEQERGVKLEFRDGEVFAMAGGTIAHGTLAARMTIAIGRALGTGPCTAASSDVKIYIEAENRGVYSDVMVYCGPPARSPHDRNAMTNPTLVVEVLSDDTELDDRGNKFHGYATLSSLREYVLVSQHEPAIEVFRREDAADTWTITRRLRGDTVTLKSVGATFSVDELYAGIELEARRSRLRPAPER